MKKVVWEKEWERKGHKRFYKHGKHNLNLQIGKYRKADAFDKKMGHAYKWHGKYYVDTWYPEHTKLFTTKTAMENYTKKKYKLDVRKTRLKRMV